MLGCIRLIALSVLKDYWKIVVVAVIFYVFGVVVVAIIGTRRESRDPFTRERNGTELNDMELFQRTKEFSQVII